MAPHNTDNDELRRQASNMAQEANYNTDLSRNDADDGEEQGSRLFAEAHQHRSI